MSFSAKVKEELSMQCAQERHCQLAELAVLIGMCGDICISASEQYHLRIHTENQSVARKCFTLLRKTFRIESDVSIRLKKNSRRSSMIFTIWIKKHADVLKILRELYMIQSDGEVAEQVTLANRLLVQRACCRRAFIRGAFLAAGSISDPEKSYHFEIACSSRERAGQMIGLIRSFGPEAKAVLRKKHFIVYVKEGGQIVDMLNIMGAHNALMDLENIRILHEMRNDVNRKVNCEAANINKTVNAAMKQREDILFLLEQTGLETLPEGLAEIARLRIDNGEASLKELGAMLTPPVGKSGVNHRLRKLSRMAEEMRQSKEEIYYDKKRNHDSAYKRT